MTLAGATRSASSAEEEKQSGHSNYFIGADASKWQREVPLYGKVRYQAIYPGIDAVYYGTDSGLEYDFVLAPRANPALVQLQFTGQDRSTLDRDGTLVLRVGTQQMLTRKPIAYQLSGGKRQEVTARFVHARADRFGIQLGTYDHTLPLIVDPKLVYSSYLGGADDEGIFGIGFDLEGNIYLAGETSSLDFPTDHPFQPKVSGSYDAFISKFDRTGSRLIYSTYLGGSMYDHAVGIAVDPSGSAYLAGITMSADFPLSHALDAHLAGASDAFVTRLSPSGSELVFSTYLGGAADEEANDIAIDAQQNVYLGGSTNSLDFPVTAGSAQTVCDRGGYPGVCTGDGFVTKLNASGSRLLYSTYLGGSSYDQVSALAVDDQGSVYVTGQTQSMNFPLERAFQARLAGYANAFVSKIDPAGSALLSSSYLGGNQFDNPTGLALDAWKNIYVTGYTSSTTFPLVQPFQANLAGMVDGFVSKVSADGTKLVYSTYLGGSNNDLALRIVVDAIGDAAITGFTASTDFPVTNAIEPEYKGGNSDAFVTRLNAGGSALFYSTYLGGKGDEFGYAINVDLTGAIWVAGSTSSTDYPQQRAYQGRYAGGPFDAFLSKITLEPADSLAVLDAGVSNLVVRQVINGAQAAPLLDHLQQARTAVKAGHTVQAIEALLSFELQLFWDVEGHVLPEGAGLQLGLAGYDILESLV